MCAGILHSSSVPNAGNFGLLEPNMDSPSRPKIVGGFVAAFATIAVAYVVLLLLAKYFLETVCMICSLGGLAVLRAFSCTWSGAMLAIYAITGLAVLVGMNILAGVVAGDGTPIRPDALIAAIFLQWIAFVVPAWAYGKQMLSPNRWSA
jgi:hypothetical protein